MNQINAKQFKEFVSRDPAWAAKLTEPVEITNYCRMYRSKITRLSTFLHFSGLLDGRAACFTDCKQLEVAEGHFAGAVEFIGCGVTKIGDLHVIDPDDGGFAAWFDDCVNLKEAEGIFPGHVSFNRSGVSKIRNLHITARATRGHAASFLQCRNLIAAEGIYPGFVDFSYSGVKSIGKLNVTHSGDDGSKANFTGCNALRLPAEFLGPEYLMDYAVRQINLGRIAVAVDQKCQSEILI